MDELKLDVKEVKGLVLELVKQGAIHNTLLAEHEKRSTNLETRIIPIEADLSFRHKLWTASATLIGILGSISGIVFSIYRMLS